MTSISTKAPLSIRLILLSTISMLTLLITIMVAKETFFEWQKLEKIKGLDQATRISDYLFDATERMSIERDIAYTMLSTDDAEILDTLRPKLEDSRKNVDAVLNIVLQKMELYDFLEMKVLLWQTSSRFASLKKERQEIDAALVLPLPERNKRISEKWFRESTAFIWHIENLWVSFIKQFSDVDYLVTLHMRYKHFLAIIMEHTGRERALIGRLIVENADPTPDEQKQLLRWQGAVESGWSLAGTLAEHSGLKNSIKPYLRDAQSHYQTVYDMIGDSFYTPGAKHGESYPISVDLWLEVAAQANDSLYSLKSAALKQTRIYVEGLEAKAKRTIAIHALLMLVTIGICVYSFWVITRRVIAPIHQMIEAMLGTMKGRPAAVNPQVAARDDEIGKLAQVLNVLQYNIEDIKRYTSDLERSNKELDDFAYIASHDLKEPLRGLSNHARFLLEDNEGKLEKESLNRLGRLVYLSQRMERLISDLLYFSRLGRHDMAIVETDMNAVVHDVETTLDVMLAERGVKIIVPKPLPIISCDKTRVIELFRNLITNAAKYNDRDEKIIEIGFNKTGAYRDGTILEDVFYVKDNGVGIAPEFHEEVFRIFKRLQTTNETQEEGTGSGLTFVKKIVERHGGKIWIKSTPGTGTTFYFTLKCSNSTGM